MPLVEKGVLIIPVESFIDNYNIVLKLMEQLVNGSIKNAIVFQEISVATVKVCDTEEKYQIAVSMNSIGVKEYNRDLIDLLKKEKTLYYIVDKPFWSKYCNLLIKRELLSKLKTILEDRKADLCVMEKERCLKVGKGLCGAGIKLVPINIVHPVSYGVFHHIDLFNEDYAKVMEHYVNNVEDTDILVYIVYNDEFEPLVKVNNVRRYVEIIYCDTISDIVRKLIINGFIWINCY
mgnify:CR=1 FL=1